MISATIPVFVLLSVHAETSHIQTETAYTASNIPAQIELDTSISEDTRDSDLSVDASKLKHLKSTDRVKRDDDELVIWDNCPGKLHYAVIDGELKCVAGNIPTGISDRVIESLDKCPKGTRKVVLPGGVMLCLERKRRRKT